MSVKDACYTTSNNKIVTVVTKERQWLTWKNSTAFALDGFISGPLQKGVIYSGRSLLPQFIFSGHALITLPREISFI